MIFSGVTFTCGLRLAESSSFALRRNGSFVPGADIANSLTYCGGALGLFAATRRSSRRLP
jgi:hypothetical protein